MENQAPERNRDTSHIGNIRQDPVSGNPAFSISKSFSGSEAPQWTFTSILPLSPEFLQRDLICRKIVMQNAILQYFSGKYIIMAINWRISSGEASVATGTETR
mgnify:CR=1 FL=1